MRRNQLPPGLPAMFRTNEATAAGVSRSRLRARDLRHPFRDVYLRVDGDSGEQDPASEEQAVVARARVAALRVPPGAFFSHVTSAVIWGLPLPRGVLGSDLDVGVFDPARPPRLSGILGHRVQPKYASVVRHPGSGLMVASPASTWAMLGATLTDYDLTAVAEGVITDRRSGFPQPLETVAHLEAAVAVGRRPGGPALRRALERVRPRVASRPETWTRLTLVDAGLPEPQVNVIVCDALGRFLACVDLAYPDLKIAIEYEGAHHLLDEHQWAADITRYEALTAAGWLVIRVTKEELFQHPSRLVARIRRALASRS